MSLEQQDHAILLNCPFFKGLTERDIERIYASGHVRRVETGELIVLQNEVPPGLCVGLEGRYVVEIQDAPNLPTARIVNLGPGDGFGELSFFDGKPASARVRSISPGRVFIIPFDVLRGLMSEDFRIERQVLWNLSEVLAQRLRATNQGLVMTRQLLIRTIQVAQGEHVDE